MAKKISKFPLLYLGNAEDKLSGILSKHKVKLILTDPPYDDYKIVRRLGLLEIIGANAIAFYPGEGYLRRASEYHYWVKPQSTKNFKKNCGRFVECIAIFRNNNTFNQLHWSQMTGVHFDKLMHKQIHPHEKPETLIRKLILIYSNPGDIVLDPFMGSGLVPKIAQELGRKGIGIENDATYFKLAKKFVQGKNE